MLVQALTLLSSFAVAAQLPSIPTAANARVAGRVVDAETSAPVPGAFVMLVPVVQQVPPVAMNPPQTVTDTNGDFALDRVWPGRYRVQVRKAGFAGIDDAQETLPLDLNAGASLTGLAFALKRGSVIAGRMLDAGGAPLRDVMVHALRLLPAAEGRPSGASRTMQMSQTDDRGEFRLPDLPKGQYIVIAAPPPRPPFDTSQPPGGTVPALTFYPGTTEREAAQVIDVGAAQTITGVQFALAALPARQIAGVVVDEAGSPQPDLTLMVMPGPGGVGPMTPVMVKTDRNGAFTVGGLPAGVYRLTAMVPMAMALPYSANAAPSGTAGPAVGGVAVALPTGGIQTQNLPAAEVTVGITDVTGVRIVVPSRR